ncbi:MAG: glycogen/starch/alpha-glucan phosphorylase [Oscillospiraceae bacterium]|nr:glycogen/starch/alpha-glucan phosphorylase [Oscillospiraceae bacterium]
MKPNIPGVKTFKARFEDAFVNQFAKPLAESSAAEQYSALATLVRTELTKCWIETNKRYHANDARQVYYFSLEFLMGQCLESHLIYLGWRGVCEEGLSSFSKELGLPFDFDKILASEPDAGLGNGGLGRLAACFLDSLAAMGYPGHGCGIRYRHGLFTQEIVNGYQVEIADGWLREKNDWEIRKPDKAVIVEFNGRVVYEPCEDGGYRFRLEDTQKVRAVPHDVPIPCFGCTYDGQTNGAVNTLRLWKAEAETEGFNFQSFSRGDYVGATITKYLAESISEVLYPDDSTYQNRVLRLKQQYFMCSAGLQSILRHYLKDKRRALSDFADKVCIHINDTHPALAVPELMRLLMDGERLSWDEAWSITTRAIAYTNHTILPEALEKWPVETMRDLLPRVYLIIEEINRRFCAELMVRFPDDPDRWSRMAIIGDGVVRMAHLAIVGSFSVNGVAAVHSELLKNVVLKDFYELTPHKFSNKTNGITHRRWLVKSNPELTAFITETLKGAQWMEKPLLLKDLEAFKDDGAALDRLDAIKLHNKKRLAKFIKEYNDAVIDPSAIFDVQVKRIHGYKRQLMNLLHIIYLYNRIMAGEDIGAPRVFIMAGKAAPSYYFAKNVIKLANELSAVIAREPRCKDKLSLVFLRNYGISIAERIFPAAEVSEQISTASKEASGTSNMKFMMNGALTLGTADGANIEIFDLVGEENGFLFGMTVEDVLSYYKNGGYDPRRVFESDPRLKACVAFLRSSVHSGPSDEFINILNSLFDYGDEFFVLGDFDAYVKAQERVCAAYADRRKWSRMSLINIAQSGVFSSDNTISQYAEEIWKIKPVR